MGTPAHLPNGRINPHVNATMGPDANLMKFYSTLYSTQYMSAREPYKPRLGRHFGTGYKSNFRPGVYYNSRLDQVDNPVMGILIADNYCSMSHNHFTPISGGSDGKDPFPWHLHQVGSGFIRQLPVSTPTSDQVKSVFVDTKNHGPAITATGVLPRHRSYLQKIQAKDPICMENSEHGPNFMSTESSCKFKDKPELKPFHVDQHLKNAKNLEETGYTHAYNIEPITFHPNIVYKGNMPGWIIDRPTGTSMTKSCYLPSEHMNGNDPFPYLSNNSVRETGFTREQAKPLYVFDEVYSKKEDMPKTLQKRIKKENPAEYLNMSFPNNHSSIVMKSYLGQQRPMLSEAEKLARFNIGIKENSGYQDNADNIIHFGNGTNDPKRWISDYHHRFYNINPSGKIRAGRTFGEVMDQKQNGFTRSTTTHNFTSDHVSTHQLHPYVARSIKKRN